MREQQLRLGIISKEWWEKDEVRGQRGCIIFYSVAFIDLTHDRKAWIMWDFCCLDASKKQRSTMVAHVSWCVGSDSLVKGDSEGQEEKK